MIRKTHKRKEPGNEVGKTFLDNMELGWIPIRYEWLSKEAEEIIATSGDI
jgi:hypothetical protein